MELRDLKALEAVLKALVDLNEDEQGRVLRWAAEKLNLAPARAAPKGGAPVPQGDDLTAFASVAEALAATNAKTDVDRALVAAAFLSKKNNQEELTGQDINSKLKDAGHGIGNITKALTHLKSRKPQLMVQTKKTGTTKQGRKNYKVTAAGYTAIAKLLQEPAEDRE